MWRPAAGVQGTKKIMTIKIKINTNKKIRQAEASPELPAITSSSAASINQHRADCNAAPPGNLVLSEP